jgi:hypothetical protein
MSKRRIDNIDRVQSDVPAVAADERVRRDSSADSVGALCGECNRPFRRTPATFTTGPTFPLRPGVAQPFDPSDPSALTDRP